MVTNGIISVGNHIIVVYIIMKMIECTSVHKGYFQHLPGAKALKMVHPTICSHVTHYIILFKSLKGCTCFKIYAPSSQNVQP